VSNPDLGAGSANGNVLKSVCDAINLPGVSSVTVAITLTDTVVADSLPTRLEYGVVTVVADTNSLSGVPIITGILPDTLANSARFRVEQDGNWTSFGATACP
jgi:hypothetical protein